MYEAYYEQLLYRFTIHPTLVPNILINNERINSYSPEITSKTLRKEKYLNLIFR